MKVLKEYFTWATTIKCFVFAMIVSLLYVMRFAFVKHVAFFSLVAFKTYIAFTIINFLLFLFVFFILFLLASRSQDR